MPASCALTQGHALPCRDNTAGVAQILIGEHDQKLSETITSGRITDFTMNTGKKFWVYNVDDEDGELVSVENNNPETGTLFYEKTLTFSIKQLTSSARNELNLIAKSRVMAIVKDNNGLYWMMGNEKGALKTGTNEARTGKAMGDLAGYNITLIAKEPDPETEVDSSLITALTTAAP